MVVPCIAGESYETGPEVLQQLVAGGLPEPVARCSAVGEREHVDLRACVTWQLERLGVAVHQVARDTATDAGCFSHRAHRGDTGRLAGVIARPVS